MELKALFSVIFTVKAVNVCSNEACPLSPALEAVINAMGLL